MRGFFVALEAYGQAVHILFSRKFWWFLLFPLLVLFLLLMGGNMLVLYAGDSIYALFEDKLREWVSGISWLEWVGTATGIVIVILLKIIYFFLFISFGGYIILVVMSPVYSWLSERTEAHLTGKKYPFSFPQFAREIFRGIGIALRNMFFQLGFTLLFFICSFIPLVGFLSPVAIFLTSAYFYGFSFLDYSIERKRFNIKQSVRYINRNIWTVIGIGTVFALSLMIPWFSLMACCFVSLLSVMAGTIVVHREEQKAKCKKM